MSDGTGVPRSIKRQARVAGLLYFLACVTAPFSLIYVPRTLIVPGDATATADRVRASVNLLRFGIADELFVVTLLIFAVIALYRLFKDVHRDTALAMAVLILVSVPVSLFVVVNELAALALVSGGAFLAVFEQRQLDALAYLSLRLHGQGLLVAQVFWGLWLFPFGRLAIRSGFIPRVLGVLLMIAGSGYIASSLAALFLPRYSHPVGQLAMFLEFGELPMLIWLLVWGAKPRPSSALEAGLGHVVMP